MAGIGNVEYRVLTKIEDSKIIQELQQLNDLTTEVYEAITRKIIHTQDAQIVQALKNLGWTPPANKVCELQGKGAVQMNDTKKQDNNTKMAMPVCPFCKEEMVLTSYQGYYDSFCYWGCDCDDDALEKRATFKWRGNYA